MTRRKITKDPHPFIPTHPDLDKITSKTTEIGDIWIAAIAMLFQKTKSLPLFEILIPTILWLRSKLNISFNLILVPGKILIPSLDLCNSSTVPTVPYWAVLRIRIGDPVPFWSLDPGSGMGKKSGYGSGINIPDPQHCCRGRKKNAEKILSFRGLSDSDIIKKRLKNFQFSYRS